MEPLNKGHIGTRSFVLYGEVSFIQRLKCTGIYNSVSGGGTVIILSITLDFSYIEGADGGGGSHHSTVSKVSGSLWQRFI